MKVGVDAIMVQGREAGGHVIGQVLKCFPSSSLGYVSGLWRITLKFQMFIVLVPYFM